MTWTLSPLESLWCAFALFWGYAVRGIAGFGSGVVATPLLTFVLPISTTAPLVTAIGFVVSVRQAWLHWSDIAWPAIRVFIPGIALGVPLGLWSMKSADPVLLVRLLGAYVVAEALWTLFGERLFNRERTFPRWLLLPVGVLGAWIATLFGGLAGPLYALYFDSLKLPKGVFRVTVSTTLLVLNIVRSIGYVGTGIFRGEDLPLILAAFVPVALGTWAGEWVHDRIDQKRFRTLVAVLLVASGIALVVR